MEWKHLLVTEEQNTIENGYGPDGDPMLKAWAQHIYGVDYFPTFDEVQATVVGHKAASRRYFQLLRGHKTRYVDLELYSRRMVIVAKTLLLDANLRGRTATLAARRADPSAKVTKAVIHVVGLG